jgi:hypothetical protein
MNEPRSILKLMECHCRSIEYNRRVLGLGFRFVPIAFSHLSNRINVVISSHSWMMIYWMCHRMRISWFTHSSDVITEAESSRLAVRPTCKAHLLGVRSWWKSLIRWTRYSDFDLLHSHESRWARGSGSLQCRSGTRWGAGVCGVRKLTNLNEWEWPLC